jgi:hypothetical protein
MRIRLARPADLPDSVLRREAEDVRGRLGEAVALDDVDAAVVPDLEQRLRHRRAPDDGAAQRREVGRREHGLLRQEQVVRRHAHHRRHALLLDQGEAAARVEGPLEHDTSTLPPPEQRLHVPAAAVELRQDLQDDVVAGDAGGEVEAQVRPEAVAVREQRALGSARRPGRVDQHERIVVFHDRVDGLAMAARHERLGRVTGRPGELRVLVLHEEERRLGVL